MNFYALAGARVAPDLLKLALDKGSQDQLSAMLGPLAEEMAGGDHVPFAPGYRAEEGEVLSVSPYELPDALAPLMNAAAAGALPDLDQADLEQGRVRALAAVEWNGVQPGMIAFQRLEARYLLKPEAWRFMLAGGRLVRDQRVGLQVSERIDAVFEPGTLFVGSWPRAHAILDLSAWIREATLTEAQDFLKHKKFALAKDFEVDTVADSWVRRKIASISESKVLSRCTVNALRQYAKEFGVVFQVSKGKMVLPADKKGFKAILKLLDEDLLSFGPTDERWLVNSKRRASS